MGYQVFFEQNSMIGPFTGPDGSLPSGAHEGMFHAKHDGLAVEPPSQAEVA